MADPVNGLLAARMDPERRRRIGNALLAYQYDRETPQDAPVTERAGLFPLGTYANGQTGIAWPGIVATPVEKMAQVLRGEITPGTPEFNEAGFDIAGAAMVGGLAAARPRGSLGMSGRPTIAEEVTRGTAAPSDRLPVGSSAPNPPPSLPMGAGQPVPVLSRPPHLQGPAPHTTIADDLLPSASFAPWTVEGYNVAAGDIGPLRTMLQQQFVNGFVPSGWYVHGRANRGNLDTGNVIQATERPDVASQYAGRSGGSIWALREADNAKVADFTSDTTQDALRTSAKALQDYRGGVLPFAADLQGTSGREMSQEVRSSFAPPRIVNSAGAFDNPDWTQWLYDRTGAEFVKTPDGAVAMSPENVQAVRLFANARPGAALGAGLSGASERQGIRAYHGSPHDFDRFDMSKIGTGEGAQAYGHGLYFAEKEGVARKYRDDLSVQTINGAEPNGRNPLHVAAQYIHGSGGNRAEAIAALEARAKTYHDWPEEKKISLDAIEAIKKDANRWFGKSSIPTIDGGKMYEVNIKANPDDFLDWDRPLSQQSEKVRGALETAGLMPWRATHVTGQQYGPMPKDDALAISGNGKRSMVPALDANGSQIFEFQTGAGRPVAKPEISQALRDAGVAGVRYLDQGSRNAGEGSRNYVVFDANLIEILRKYGLLGMLGAGGMAQELMKPSKPNIPDDAA